MPKLMYDDKNYSGNASSSGGGMFPHLIVISETGSTVTASKGSTVITARETSTDHFECDLVTPNPQDTYGTWLIHAILNGDDAQANLVVDTVKVYTVDDEHFHADIIVTYPDGSVVSCTKDGLSPMYATSSPYTFTVHSIGMYTISGERDGITEIVEVDIISNGQTENVTLELLPDGKTITPTDNIQILLHCADIDNKSYTTISELLADDTTLLKVLTHNNAIDYLVRSTTYASLVTADSDAMAMIGSYDYASDTLLTDSTWATAIVSSAYVNSVENIGTPTMTGATTPSGECSAKTTAGSSYPAWKAFDKNNSTLWASAINSSDDYLRYKFAKAQKINAVKVKTLYSGSLRLKTLSIKASNDSFSTSATLMETITLTNQNVEDYVYLVNPLIAYDSYGIENLSTYQSDIEIKELDFLGRQNGGVQSWLKAGGIQKSYTQLSQILEDTATLRDLMASKNAVDYLVTAKAFIDDICANQTAMSLIGANDYATNSLLADATWAEAIVGSAYKESVLNVKVPVMTSNTTPSGEASASTEYDSSHKAFHAFDGNGTTSWVPTLSTNPPHWIKYKFASPICAKVFVYNTYPNNRTGTFKVQGSNNNSTWADLTDALTAIRDGQEHSVILNNSNTYTYYRMYITTQTEYGTSHSTIQFYGRETGGVQTWLRAGGITDKSYTTLAEVLADTTTLSALIASHDAVDYLVTAKGLIDGITSDATAMSYIGLNNYCSNTLLADADWANGIAKSANIESVSNVKVPTMTSATTPSGTVISDGVNYATGYDPWKAFRGATTGNLWCLQTVLMSGNHYCGYIFTSAVKIFGFKMYRNSSASFTPTIKVQGSNDGNTWDDVYIIPTQIYANKAWHIFGFPLSDEYTQYRVYGVFNGAGSDEGMALQFYGREDV